MAEPFNPLPVKMFSGFIYTREDVFLKAVELLTVSAGKPDFISEPIPFSHTSYYGDLGSSLQKKFVSFKNLVNREVIPSMKIRTNGIESLLAQDGNRIINIDPGYLTMSNVFLASCKDYYHRIYISEGVYMENELRYTEKKYMPFEWTYPDFKTEEYIAFFLKLRGIYSAQLKTEKKK